MAYDVSGLIPVSNLAVGIAGNKTIAFGTINITSYTTSGETLVAGDFGLNTIDHIIFTQLEGTVPYSLIKIAAKLWGYVLSSGAEVTSTTDIGTFSFIAIGTGKEWA